MGLDSRHILLVTDDRSPESLVEEGHINFVLRHAIRQGVRPVTAFQMVTLNPAESFGVWRGGGSGPPAPRGAPVLPPGGPARGEGLLALGAGGGLGGGGGLRG